MRKLFKYMIVFVYTVVHTMQLVKQHNNIMTDISSSTGITELYSLSLLKCYHILKKDFKITEMKLKELQV